ncbi:30S ribosomal protein S18 [Candidatus Woesebacteria bacterium RIFCSPLOWO2_01_FULL_39_23]|uniref:Small ribosomal subunit protein bS18 n=1 Tax=Candidatus Woesebacteria bacterium RIFCSPHIGHO2_01_FULL_40_22 TaxID=1802499 RepID=A0A1F7YIZ1_9BACT|nr:MAG: 30S ribosomal protein S18 [Candidatus Woesebacteria bacterium RBG_16_40_11]OGM27316.1 MAG: 30S ribosomal protein S18 [Candidatus Woesebacteria bacterium RIFCSPHIGHO2_01_FULL_40_22]OGM36986.1 MAG: 30S ribosomal protein S18 [Candidatus Woesebacteria bacterium RIFCSPHIGHO2_12_FULL_38_9]OGM62488.1 MAG: 30S ribosomal protein S18 [Candidatus Woesebacteria bacterium RIFCSPLOWO2_01_FULL_39_23]
MKKRQGQRKPNIKPKKGACPFCKNNLEPDYKNYKELSNFISDRAKIIASIYTSVCAKHQRRLGVQLKRARHLGLLPYLPQA